MWEEGIERRCVVCDREIPKARLKLLPHTETCVKHSKVRSVTEDEVGLDGTDSSEFIKQLSGS